MTEISIKKAAFINAIARYSTIVLNLGFSAVLARLLSPEDYGIVAITTVFTTFFMLFADMGIGAGIIQNKELSEDDVNNIFTFTVRISIILAFVFMTFSLPLSWFYKNKVYIPIGLLLAVSLFFNAINMVPNALLLKYKHFMAVGIRTIIVCVVTGIFGIVLALIGLKYYALILQSVFNALFVFVWNYFSTKPKLVKNICKNSLNKIKGYSSFLFGFNIVNYFARNIDNLFISKFMGAAALGYYDKAYKLMLYPVGNLTHVITPVLHPILSEHQNDKKYIYKRYLEIVRLLSLAGAFITPLCFSVSDEIIRIMFGEKWESAIPCFKWMSISIWAQMILSSTGTIFQSVGDTKRLMFSGSVNAIMTIVFIVVGLLEGSIVAVSRNIAISYNVQFVFTFIVLIHCSLGENVSGFFVGLISDFIILLLCLIIGYLISIIELDVLKGHLVLSFVVKGGGIVAIYIVLLFLFHRQKVFMRFFKR